MAKGSDNQFPSILVTEQASAPMAPAAGDQRIYMKTDHKLYHINSSSVETEVGGGTGSVPDYICINEQQTQNTAGGNFTSGAWRTRVLNTEVSDTGGHASINSNQITLDAGTYQCRISCPAASVDRHQAKLYNISDSADILIGTSECVSTASSVVTKSLIQGVFTLAAQKVLEIRHQCQTSSNTTGFGFAANFTTEVYTVAEFWKVA